MTLTEHPAPATRQRRFEFSSDTFAFANELLWEYQADPLTGKTNFRPRTPKPAYSHRCFVLVRAARQFLYHARFEPQIERTSDTVYAQRVRQIMARDPRLPCAPPEQIVIPGHASLREFSAAHEGLLKQNCGGAWQSYVLRSHWRMVLPLSPAHQVRTAASLTAALAQNRAPIIHLVQFPALTINHGMIVFAATPSPAEIQFSCYDPNMPSAPAEVTFHRATGTFSLPANAYWAGGDLKVIEIFRNWLM